MGTKNNPGTYDCYENAEPDEPMFTLLGRDPSAHLLVRLWADVRASQGRPEDSEKIEEAQRCADAMEAWAITHGKAGEPMEKTAEAFLEVCQETTEDDIVLRSCPPGVP